MFIATSFVALSLISSVSTPRAPSSAAVGALRKHTSMPTKALHYPGLHGSRQPGCLFSSREQEVASSRNASNSICFAINKPRRLQSRVLEGNARKVASPVFSYQSQNASIHEFARFKNRPPAKHTTQSTNKTMDELIGELREGTRLLNLTLKKDTPLDTAGARSMDFTFSSQANRILDLSQYTADRAVSLFDLSWLPLPPPPSKLLKEHRTCQGDPVLDRCPVVISPTTEVALTVLKAVGRTPTNTGPILHSIRMSLHALEAFVREKIKVFRLSVYSAVRPVTRRVRHIRRRAIRSLARNGYLPPFLYRRSGRLSIGGKSTTCAVRNPLGVLLEQPIKTTCPAPPPRPSPCSTVLDVLVSALFSFGLVSSICYLFRRKAASASAAINAAIIDQIYVQITPGCPVSSTVTSPAEPVSQTASDSVDFESGSRDSVSQPYEEQEDERSVAEAQSCDTLTASSDVHSNNNTSAVSAVPSTSQSPADNSNARQDKPKRVRHPQNKQHTRRTKK